MDNPDPMIDLLKPRAMPALAAALRERCGRVIERWNDAVKRYVPDADPLTAQQVRNSIPMVLEKVALALESDRPEATVVLAETGTAHGIARFQQHYAIDQVIAEYRLLRRIVFDELHDAAPPHGRGMGFVEAVAVDTVIDTSLQRGVTAYVDSLTTRLRAAAAAESKYLSFLSHDLRNNLNGVTLMLEALKLRLADLPEFAEEARDLAAGQRSVLETIEGMDRLLQAERLRRQDVALRLGPVRLHDLAATVLGHVARAAHDKGIELANDVPPDAAAYSDRELITLVLQNLLGNAIKYSSHGVVRVAGEPDPLGWRLAVSDQGPGIAPDRLQTLFDAFTRGETHGQPGVGLGLSIAAHAARLLGTELQVHSEPGRGTTFSLTFPPAEPQKAH